MDSATSRPAASSHAETDRAAIDRIVDLIGSAEATRSLVDPPAWMDQDLTFGQLRLVYLLAHHGPQSIGQIAERFQLSLTAASQFADRVERQGLAARHHRSDDRRVVELALTSAGQELVAGMLGMQREVFHDLFSVFGATELQQLETLVRTMVDRLTTRSTANGEPLPAADTLPTR